MRSDVPPDCSARLKQLRLRLGFTQTRLAEVLGVTVPTVNRWENGQLRPSSKAWRSIQRLEILGFSGSGLSPDKQPEVSEGGPSYEERGAPVIDFSANPEIVRAVVEGERLTFGHLFNPAFATEISLIDPLPHQRIAVYEHMLTQPRLRFLLADDAGAGKTIMAGLYIREMLSRRLIHRVLIVPPAGLVGNWERELNRLFALPFRPVGGAEARSGNPFDGDDSDLLIVSVDTLASDRMFARLQEPQVQPYDLVIFDEAHKLAADREPDFRVRKTDRYRLAEALSGIEADDVRWQLGWSARHLLLLTATPHMGKDYPYYCLWRLLEPGILATFDAFNAYPPAARQQHFIRRVKEEMVRLDGTPIYPTRISDTLSYELGEGLISEQTLYDQTTGYITNYYNRARILNRSAARLAMSIFQRRLASSTYALWCSFNRRLAKLDALIADIHAGKITAEQLQRQQRKQLDDLVDPFEAMTGDEEGAEDGAEPGREQNEAAQDLALGSVVAVNLAELENERRQVEHLRDLARQVDDLSQESKFARLREIIENPEYRDEKLIIFTEHRDTLEFLVRRLEGLGYTGQVARIHGGMSTQPAPGTGLSERDQQVEFFRKPHNREGARFLVCTDAAGEGINLQFCWIMVNYDIPWNPARLEQRMGRIHRYGQRHDPVVILNLVAGKTREGRVIKTLLEKLERIRKELRSDKVFDVVGRLFEGVSLRDYMEQAIAAPGTDDIERRLESRLTKEQVLALQERERALFGGGGDVGQELPRLRAEIDQEAYRRLLPGYVRRYLERAAPLVRLAIDGDLNSVFSLRPIRPGALDPLWPALEAYPAELSNRFTVERPGPETQAIFLHPGETFFDQFCGYVAGCFAESALRGAVFVDPMASAPYSLHLALTSLERGADLAFPAFVRPETLECRMVAVKQDEAGSVEACPVEVLLLLQDGTGVPSGMSRFLLAATERCQAAEAFIVDQVTRPLAEARRLAMLGTLAEREDFLRRGYDYQAAELAQARSRYTERARAGDPRARGELTRIQARQRALAQSREEALAVLRREPELIGSGQVQFMAHALVVPSGDPEDRARYDADVEVFAVKIAWAYEKANGALVRDVSTPPLARAAGLEEHPGFDLLSRYPDGSERAIEVKGRARFGKIEWTENEHNRACNLRSRYWLYIVFGCSTGSPRLCRVCDPFARLIVRLEGSVMVDERQILSVAIMEEELTA